MKLYSFSSDEISLLVDLLDAEREVMIEEVQTPEFAMSGQRQGQILIKTDLLGSILNKIETTPWYFGVKRWVKDDVLQAAEDMGVTLDDDQVEDVIRGVDKWLAECTEEDWHLIRAEINRVLREV